MPDMPVSDRRTAESVTDSSHPETVIIEGATVSGKRCRIIDNTGTVERAELQNLLDELIREKRFGFSGISSVGGSAITIGAPVFAHVQLGGKLYRLVLFPYEARIERF